MGLYTHFPTFIIYTLLYFSLKIGGNITFHTVTKLPSLKHKSNHAIWWYLAIIVNFVSGDNDTVVLQEMSLFLEETWYLVLKYHDVCKYYRKNTDEIKYGKI